jgi:hypothetical protein
MSAVSVRRLAWSLGVSMPKAGDQVVSLLPSLFPPGVVCLTCKDNTNRTLYEMKPKSSENSKIQLTYSYKKLGFKELGTISGGFRMDSGKYENIIPFIIELVPVKKQ